MIKAGKLISINSVTNTSRFSQHFYLKCSKTLNTRWRLYSIIKSVLNWQHPFFSHVFSPSISLSLSPSLLGVFSLVLWWPYMGPFSGARLFPAVLNSKTNELPNKAHIGNSMSLAGLVVYSKMITARQKAWKGTGALTIMLHMGLWWHSILTANRQWLNYEQVSATQPCLAVVPAVGGTAKCKQYYVQESYLNI